MFMQRNPQFRTRSTLPWVALAMLLSASASTAQGKHRRSHQRRPLRALDAMRAQVLLHAACHASEGTHAALHGACHLRANPTCPSPSSAPTSSGSGLTTTR